MGVTAVSVLLSGLGSGAELSTTAVFISSPVAAGLSVPRIRRVRLVLAARVPSIKGLLQAK